MGIHPLSGALPAVRACVDYSGSMVAESNSVSMVVGGEQFRLVTCPRSTTAIRGVAAERFLRADELARKLDADCELFLEERAWLSQKLAEVQIAFSANRDDLLQQDRGR